MNDTDDHRRLRESLGAYVLGALEPEERRSVDAHLAGCATCRDELAWLSSMPPMLNRLTREEVLEGQIVQPPPPPDLASLEPFLAPADAPASTDDDPARLRRSVRAWRAATGLAAAAAVAVFVAWAPWQSNADTLDRLVLQPVAASTDVDGTATAIAWEWGTTVDLDLEALPPADGYVVVTVSRSGQRQQAGSWGPTESGSARVRGASSIQRPDLAAIFVEDADGNVLARFAVDDPV